MWPSRALNLSIMSLAIASLVAAGCRGEEPKKKPQEPATSSALPADAAAAETPAGPEAAKQQAIDNARKAGVLGLLEENQGLAKGQEARPGPPNAWWNKPDACAAGTTLKIESRGPQAQIACVETNGAFHGRFAEWNLVSDSLWSEATYKHGKRHGLHTLYSAGQKLFETNYADGKANGSYTVYSDGRVAMRGSYKQGMRNDRWTEVDAAGKVTATMPFKDGRPHGTWTGGKADRTWKIVFKNGAASNVESTRNGKAIPTADLASHDVCERMAARYRAESGAADAIDSLEPFIYAECRIRKLTEAECVLASKSKQQADACLAEP